MIMKTPSRPLLFIAFLALAPVVALAADSSKRWRIDFENGYVSGGYNDVQIPRSTGTRFSLKDDFDLRGGYYFRVRVEFKLHPRHTLSALYAPLTVKAAGVIPSTIMFNDTAFPAGAAADGVYRFNSYRLTYRYELVRSEKWLVGIGFTAKIRDAAISLKTESVFSEKTNVGFVPLFHFRAQWTASSKLAFHLEGDALASPGGQGRAEDIALTLRYRISPAMTIKAGYRFVEGGADVEEVYNFAFISYFGAGLVIEL
jgi:hypothetical protein